MTCLGISVGTRITGIAVLKDDLLLARTIHQYSDAWSNKKLRQVTNRYRQYILKYNVTDIVIKVPPSSRHTKEIKLLISHIERLANEYGCAFDLITKREIKDQTVTRSTKEIIKYTCLLYPELIEGHPVTGKHIHPYYNKMYEAVLSAHLYGSERKYRQNARQTIK